jgi:hypothetical protein
MNGFIVAVSLVPMLCQWFDNWVLCAVHGEKKMYFGNHTLSPRREACACYFTCCRTYSDIREATYRRMRKENVIRNYRIYLHPVFLVWLNKRWDEKTCGSHTQCERHQPVKVHFMSLLKGLRELSTSVCGNTVHQTCDVFLFCRFLSIRLCKLFLFTVWIWTVKMIRSFMRSARAYCISKTHSITLLKLLRSKIWMYWPIESNHFRQYLYCTIHG